MLLYRVYRNGGGGLADPIDYSTVIASGSASPIELPALDAPGDYLIGVRVYDSAVDLEDGNIDVIVRLRIAADGTNVTSLPNGPTAIAAYPLSATSIAVLWDYHGAGEGGSPTGFRIWANTGGSVDYGDPPALTVARSRDQASYFAILTGLSAGSWSIGVRAYNATGEDPNELSATVELSATGPDSVEGLTAETTA